MSDEKRPVDQASEEVAKNKEAAEAGASNAPAPEGPAERVEAARENAVPASEADAKVVAAADQGAETKVVSENKAPASADPGTTHDMPEIKAEAKPAAEAAPAADADKPKVKPAPKAAATASADGAAPAKKAPPKKEAPPPDPRAIAAKEMADQIKATIEASLGAGVVEEAGAAQFKSSLLIKKERWPEVVDLLKRHEAWRFDYLEMMAGTDYKDYIEVTIMLQSTSLGHCALLKTRTDRENAEIPSLYSVHPGTNWEEREIYDLVGVTFTNHPDLRRIMMWDGFKGHPLRKDYTPWEGEEDPDVAE